MNTHEEAAENMPEGMEELVAMGRQIVEESGHELSILFVLPEEGLVMLTHEVLGAVGFGSLAEYRAWQARRANRVELRTAPGGNGDVW